MEFIKLTSINDCKLRIRKNNIGCKMKIGDKVFFIDKDDEDYEEIRMIHFTIISMCDNLFRLSSDGYDFIVNSDQIKLINRP